jgi:hypothetical protein
VRRLIEARGAGGRRTAAPLGAVIALAMVILLGSAFGSLQGNSFQAKL